MAGSLAQSAHTSAKELWKGVKVLKGSKRSNGGKVSKAIKGSASSRGSKAIGWSAPAEFHSTSPSPDDPEDPIGTGWESGWVSGWGSGETGETGAGRGGHPLGHAKIWEILGETRSHDE